jgi:hypothetical protein
VVDTGAFDMANAVIGHYPGYVTLASKVDCARWFSIPAATWNLMSPSQQWAANVSFLNAVIGHRDSLVFSHHPRQARLGSSFYRELMYLRSRGVTVMPTQDAHVP